MSSSSLEAGQIGSDQAESGGCFLARGQESGA